MACLLRGCEVVSGGPCHRAETAGCKSNQNLYAVQVFYAFLSLTDTTATLCGIPPPAWRRATGGLEMKTQLFSVACYVASRCPSVCLRPGFLPRAARLPLQSLQPLSTLWLCGGYRLRIVSSLNERPVQYKWQRKTDCIQTERDTDDRTGVRTVQKK